MQKNIEKRSIKPKDNCKKGALDIIKNRSGITLVALVITIVILIILATITVNFMFGGEGLITRAD